MIILLASVRISELNLNVLCLSARTTFEFQTNNVIRLFIDYSFSPNSPYNKNYKKSTIFLSS